MTILSRSYNKPLLHLYHNKYLLSLARKLWKNDKNYQKREKTVKKGKKRKKN